MDESYMKSLEKRNAELVDKLEQVSALLNSYQKMVKFEIHTHEFVGPASFSPQKSISLTVNNGAANRVFAQVKPANNAIGHGGWEFTYGNPFDGEFAQEKQHTITLTYPQIIELYKKYCIDSKIKFNEDFLDNPDEILVIIAMDLTGTSHIEYKLTSTDSRYH